MGVYYEGVEAASVLRKPKKTGRLPGFNVFYIRGESNGNAGAVESVHRLY